MEARPVSQSKVVMTEMVLPSHTNSLDSIFGGIIMSWTDIAAAIGIHQLKKALDLNLHLDNT